MAEIRTTVDRLPDNLLTEILIRIPCKSCFKSKSVCKRWLSLVSHSHFTRKFINHHKTITTLSEDAHATEMLSIVFMQGYIYQVYPLTYLPCFRVLVDRKIIRPISVIGSYNDLLLCCSLGENDCYYLTNPFTKQWTQVQLPTDPGRVRIGFISFPKFHHHHHDSNNKDSAGTVDLSTGYTYKIVRIPFFKEVTQTRFHMEIFSSETGKCSESVTPNATKPISFFNMSSFAVAAGGILYWHINRSRHVLIYEPLNDVFRFILKPEDMNHNLYRDCVGNCRGWLRISELRDLSPLLYNNNAATVLRVWELDDITGPGKWQFVHGHGFR